MKKAALIAMFLLTGAALSEVSAPLAQAGTNCYPSYQACRNGCGGNTTCLANCWDWYNACRGY